MWTGRSGYSWFQGHRWCSNDITGYGIDDGDDKAIDRRHLEYCIHTWRPYRKEDIETLEKIQRRPTKIIPELRELSYEERLRECRERR